MKPMGVGCLRFLFALLLIVGVIPLQAQHKHKQKRKKQNKAVAKFTISRNARPIPVEITSIEGDPIRKTGRVFKAGVGRLAEGSDLPCPDLKPEVKMRDSRQKAIAYQQTQIPQTTYEPPVQNDSVLSTPPIPPSTVSPEKPPKPVLRPLYFVFDEDELTQQDMETIRNAASYVQHGYKIVIEGHTDSYGNDFYNEQLSKRRAERIKKIMVQTTGISPDVITVKAYGETRPAVPNNSPESRRLNRRVEIKVVD